MRATKLFLLFSLTTLIAKAQYSWMQQTNFGGTARYGSVAFSIGNYGYVGTGWDGSVFQNDFWQFDPSTNSWTQKANFGGGPRHGATGFSIGAKGYAGL